MSKDNITMNQKELIKAISKEFALTVDMKGREKNHNVKRTKNMDEALNKRDYLTLKEVEKALPAIIENALIKSTNGEDKEGLRWREYDSVIKKEGDK